MSKAQTYWCFVKDADGWYLKADPDKSCGASMQPGQRGALRFRCEGAAAMMAASHSGRLVRMVIHYCDRCGKRRKYTHDGGAGRELCSDCGEAEGAPMVKRSETP